MTDGHSLTSGALLQIALSALTNHSADEAEEKLASIITSIEQHYGENQKEVANELQRLAKEIENSGQIEKAIEFKQRTTELMLRISMERRRGLRESRTPMVEVNPNSNSSSVQAYSPPAVTHLTAPAALPPVAAPNNARTTRANLGALSPSSADSILGKNAGASLFESIHYVVQSCSNFETELHFYSDVLKGKMTWKSDDLHRRAAAIRLASGPELILVESQIPASSLNVYLVTTIGAAREILESYGFLKRGELKTPIGHALIFSGPDGSTLAIISTSGK
ncbi:MAG: hypothetical protein C0508_09655 [Cyanobacteria bacterium PR.023]|nr:hypothetical protein [Cyanobacteria bacterium PR.023]